MLDIWTALGTRPAGDRLARMQQSPQFENGTFANTLPESEPDPWPIMKRFLFEDKRFREPAEPIPVVQRTADEFATAPSDLRITWFGHSSLLVEIDGRRILFDPVWGDYASPNTFLGVKRFYAPPITLDDLPPLDAVVLSHDHYDHLNEPTIKALAERVPRFITPLGVGAHLEYWGVPADRIVELDWWGRLSVDGVEVVCTPARHFSGRFLNDRNATLWSSWALLGRDERVFFSGDTGMFPGFTEIGDRLGPFDVTMIEVGAYDASWADIHMGPEQAVEAHRMVRGGVMIPVHWGTFRLAFHVWTEPMERALVAAKQHNIPIVTLRPGASLTPSSPPPVDRWWPSLPWKTAEEAPIVSSGMEKVGIE